MAKTTKEQTDSSEASVDLAGALNLDLKALLSGADSSAGIFPETSTVLREASALAQQVQVEARQKRQDALKQQAEALAEGLRERAASLDDRVARRMEEVTAADKEKFVLAGRVFVKAGTGLPSVRVQLKAGKGDQGRTAAVVRTDPLGFFRMELEARKSNEAEQRKLGPVKDKPELFLEVLDEQGNLAFRSPRAIALRPGKVTFVDSAVDGEHLPKSLDLGRREERRISAEIAHAERSKSELESRLNIRLDRQPICR